MMACKQKKASAKPERDEYPRKVVQCEDGVNGEERGRKYAALLTSPELAAFRVVRVAENNFDMEKHIDVPTLVETFREQARAVNGNDLAKAEAMLINQATALQSLFVRLAEKAFSAGLHTQFESFMRMSLRAQNQCRATLETLAAIKNPPMVIAKQANITSGPQQINNGMTIPSRVQQNENEQTQLSGENNELRTHTGTPALAGRIDQKVEALGKVDRAAN